MGEIKGLQLTKILYEAKKGNIFQVKENNPKGQFKHREYTPVVHVLLLNNQ